MSYPQKQQQQCSVETAAEPTANVWKAADPAQVDRSERYTPDGQDITVAHYRTALLTKQYFLYDAGRTVGCYR